MTQKVDQKKNMGNKSKLRKLKTDPEFFNNLSIKLQKKKHNKSIDQKRKWKNITKSKTYHKNPKATIQSIRWFHPQEKEKLNDFLKTIIGSDSQNVTFDQTFSFRLSIAVAASTCLAFHVLYTIGGSSTCDTHSVRYPFCAKFSNCCIVSSKNCWFGPSRSQITVSAPLQIRRILPWGVRTITDIRFRSLLKSNTSSRTKSVSSKWPVFAFLTCIVTWKRPISQSIDQWTNRPINRSNNKQIDQSINQTINQTVTHSVRMSFQKNISQRSSRIHQSRFIRGRSKIKGSFRVSRIRFWYNGMAQRKGQQEIVDIFGDRCSTGQTRQEIRVDVVLRVGFLGSENDASNAALPKYHFILRHRAGFVGKDVFDLAKVFVEVGGASQRGSVRWFIVHFQILKRKEKTIINWSINQCNNPTVNQHANQLIDLG